jgi:xanthine dehydrogenase accessory factor
MSLFESLASMIRQDGRAALVTLVEVRGSSPRDAGARMAVRADGAFSGTVGGGALEWQALAEAQAVLASPDGPRHRLMDKALGPDLGQCCGGRVRLAIERLGPEDLPRIEGLAAAEAEEEKAAALPVMLFGAGHVGRALILALAPLPVRVTWIDGRQNAFPRHAPANVAAVESRDTARLIGSAPDGAAILAMTHSHALDLEIVAAALAERRFAYVGVIGSATKRARFVTQLRQAGLADDLIDALVCPIGLRQIAGKEPAVIAASVAAQLLLVRGHAMAAESKGSGDLASSR